MGEISGDTILFPGAGSFGGELRPIIRELGPMAWLVKYPGRFGKDFGAAAESFEEIVQSCTTQASCRASARSVLFGHSFGAYVAYATAAKMEELGMEISALVVVGATAPMRLEVSETVSSTPSGTAAYLDSVDPAMLADLPSDEWREIIIDTAMHDLRLLRQFTTLQCRPVNCSILAIHGDSDPLTSDTGVGEWEHATHGEFSRHVFSSGHSDFLRSPAYASWFRAVRADLG
ncbi:Surfactin synthase thioesterase subunit [Actinopolyspora lacussalsi subsp. righensis]|uniref:Surfactin synthase thioesterase subunit n=1 Tax=Actinopolyspora righensis TaxID=995060 RepID=A0A1I6XGN6_9ACTN|nr:alpha/beta fold hydrolase [Actinopolyspora righensis]SFT37172.1 Surfactin synthase thioesterase subunit [Actinopolyspora righensis]